MHLNPPHDDGVSQKRHKDHHEIKNKEFVMPESYWVYPDFQSDLQKEYTEDANARQVAVVSDMFSMMAVSRLAHQNTT